MQVQGKWVILTIVAVAFLAAGTAWWNQFRRGQQTLAYWGTDSALRIRLASECELVRLPADGPREISATTFPSLAQSGQQRALTGAPGLIHARQALVQDSTYNWSQTAPPANVRWQYALIFRDPEKNQATRLLFDLEQGWVLDLDQQKAVQLAAHRESLRLYFDEQLDQSKSG